MKLQTIFRQILKLYIQEKIIDVTGVELTPGDPDVCLGNGELGFECCCDECDHFLFCFPEFNKNITVDKKALDI